MAAQPDDPGFNFFIQAPGDPAMPARNEHPIYPPMIATRVGVPVGRVSFSAR